MNRINTWLSHGRIPQWSQDVIFIVAEGNEQQQRSSTFHPTVSSAAATRTHERTSASARRATTSDAGLPREMEVGAQAPHTDAYEEKVGHQELKGLLYTASNRIDEES
eukprot:scaffold283_cov316-Pavlova_lutheri.AAC.52